MLPGSSPSYSSSSLLRLMTWVRMVEVCRGQHLLGTKHVQVDGVGIQEVLLLLVLIVLLGRLFNHGRPGQTLSSGGSLMLLLLLEMQLLLLLLLVVVMVLVLLK